MNMCLDGTLSPLNKNEQVLEHEKILIESDGEDFIQTDNINKGSKKINNNFSQKKLQKKEIKKLEKNDPELQLGLTLSKSLKGIKSRSKKRKIGDPFFDGSNLLCREEVDKILLTKDRIDNILDGVVAGKSPEEDLNENTIFPENETKLDFTLWEKQAGRATDEAFYNVDIMKGISETEEGGITKHISELKAEYSKTVKKEENLLFDKINALKAEFNEKLLQLKENRDLKIKTLISEHNIKMKNSKILINTKPIQADKEEEILNIGGDFKENSIKQNVGTDSKTDGVKIEQLENRNVNSQIKSCQLEIVEETIENIDPLIGEGDINIDDHDCKDDKNSVSEHANIYENFSDYHSDVTYDLTKEELLKDISKKTENNNNALKKKRIISPVKEIKENFTIRKISKNKSSKIIPKEFNLNFDVSPLSLPTISPVNKQSWNSQFNSQMLRKEQLSEYPKFNEKEETFYSLNDASVCNIYTNDNCLDVPDDFNDDYYNFSDYDLLTNASKFENAEGSTVIHIGEDDELDFVNTQKGTEEPEKKEKKTFLHLRESSLLKKKEGVKKVKEKGTVEKDITEVYKVIKKKPGNISEKIMELSADGCLNKKKTVKVAKKPKEKKNDNASNHEELADVRENTREFPSVENPGCPEYHKMSLTELKNIAGRVGIKPGTKIQLIKELKKIWFELNQTNYVSNEEELKIEENLIVLQKKLLNFFKSDLGLYEKILTYQPVDVDLILPKIINSGVKLSKKQLTSFFDSRGVTFICSNNNKDGKKKHY
ncbi:hypothetical protein HK099_005405 [Clydaea vesicula]|uniref:Structure-specific endonuclease subunit SLX4 n=1 Tax=Clydaea vesicula TaxID=447962 RepID=A0AAD5Y2S8_9FUNG|nr:hypothetical protein HK099_005405 [Clydaea vesicula]